MKKRKDYIPPSGNRIFPYRKPPIKDDVPIWIPFAFVALIVVLVVLEYLGLFG